MTPRFVFIASAIAIVTLGAALRIAWLRSDPPAHRPIGIIWHDEGAWTHNARNRALWGVWRTDNWNPVFVTPVFTALEFGAFELFGVGTWQARTVPVLSGLVAVVGVMLGMSVIAGRRAALAGGALMAANYVLVMWNRAALIESTMVAFMVVGWAAYTAAERRPAWGLVAGIAASLAWFTKAAAACFVAAIVVDAVWSWWQGQASREPSRRRVSIWTLVGLGATSLVVGVLFVLPHWSEYVFYNWQMSVTRKPEYTLRAIVDRASWLPVVQGTFARSWPVVVLGLLGLVAVASRWRNARAGERLAALWLVVGLAELAAHDSGNERRYLMFVPPLVALAACMVGRTSDRSSASDAAQGRGARIVVGALVALAVYLVVGSGLRIVFEEQVIAGRLSHTVRAAAIAALLATLAVWARWAVLTGALVRWRPGRLAAPALVAASVAWNVPDYADWFRHRGELNYRASIALGRSLPDGTLVHGKLANGLALENGIKPLFVGNHFGNYEDRLRRDDVQYLLTYDLPRIGYESSDGSGLIDGILERYPQRRIVATFVVDETPEADRAVLIDKGPGAETRASVPTESLPPSPRAR